MIRKYDLIDERLLQWLRDHPGEVTTAAAIKALAIECGTTQRHISRRFTLLEDRGALVCSLKGTTRVCQVNSERLPSHMHKGGLNNRSWHNAIQQEVHGPAVKPPAPSNQPGIPASNSEEFLANGGVIEKIPNRWGEAAPRQMLGPTTLIELLSELD